MLIKLSRLLAVVCALSLAPTFLQAAKTPPSVATIEDIYWYTNLEEGLARADTEKLPVFLLFEGSDWCGACKRLDQEVLDTSRFAELMGDKMVFVKIDFPRRNPLPPAQTAYNNELMGKYGVSSFPTVIILDSKGRRLTNMGYLPGGPDKYAQQIQAVINR